jgi:hypothetical protein
MKNCLWFGRLEWKIFEMGRENHVVEVELATVGWSDNKGREKKSQIRLI